MVRGCAVQFAELLDFVEDRLDETHRRSLQTHIGAGVMTGQTEKGYLVVAARTHKAFRRQSTRADKDSRWEDGGPPL